MYGLLWSDNICKSGIWGRKENLNIEKIFFKIVQIKFLAMHITNQNWSFDIFMIGNLLNIFMEHDLNILMIFGIKDKSIIWPIQCIFGYFYKYTCSAYDCFCTPGTQMCFIFILNLSLGLAWVRDQE